MQNSFVEMKKPYYDLLFIKRELYRVLSFDVSHNPIWSTDRSFICKLNISWPRRYEWAAAGDWVDMIRDNFRRMVSLTLTDDIPQPYQGTVVFEASIDSQRKQIAIGYSDFLPIDADCERTVDLYFKMQFDSNGYESERVVPGGYVADGRRLYFDLKKLRKVRSSHNFDRDVFGRFSLDYSPEIRSQAHRLLVDQDLFDYGGALQKVSYREFLNEIARSKVCVDLPGLGPLCFRLINYLAIGSCVVAYPHRALLHIPLVDREHIVYCKEDMSDLVELCSYYSQNNTERERIATNARAFFDQNLHISNLSRYYLHTIIQKLF